MNKLTALILILFCFSAQAESDNYRIGTFLQSDHHDDSFDYNESDHRSIYFCIDNDCAGVYKHSYCETILDDSDDKGCYAYFYSRTFYSYSYESFTAEAFLGIATGYEDYVADDFFTPFGGLSVKYGYFKWYQMGQVSVLGLEYEGRF